MNLTEATILALQGKLVENKIERPRKVSKLKREESIAIANDDVVVDVNNNVTKVITSNEVVTVENTNEQIVEPVGEVVPEEPSIEDVLPEETEIPVEPEEVVDDSTEGTPEGDADAGEAGFEEKAEEAEIGLEPETEENSADTFALNKAERDELNNYRKEHKIRIVESYNEYLSEEQRQTFIDNIDSYEIDSLEKEVAFVGMKSVKENKVEEKQTTSFTFVPGKATKVAKDDVGALINKYNN